MFPHRRPLIFNLTRLYSRQYSSTPTGIDRLDLRHARFAQEQHGHRTVIFAYQQRDVIRQIPFRQAKALIENLWCRWVEGKRVPPLPRSGKVSRGFRWSAMRLKRRLGLFISPEIIRALSTQPAPVFLNSAHIGTQHLSLHENIRDSLNAELVFYLHDLIPIDYPEYFSNKNGAVTHQKRVATMAKTGSTILVNSEYTRQRFARYCALEGLPNPETKVVPIGVEEHFIEASAKKQPLPPRYANLTGSYFLMLGTIEPRKNHLLLLHLWRTLYGELGKDCPTLVIVGKRGWKNDLVVDLLEHSPVLRQCVIEYNDVDDREVIPLLQNAAALLFPSFEEGWGMPLAEALTLGTRAICSDIPAFHECGQELAAYLDPLDGPAWLNAIKAMIPPHKPDPVRTYSPMSWEMHLTMLAGIVDGFDSPLS